MNFGEFLSKVKILSNYTYNNGYGNFCRIFYKQNDRTYDAGVRVWKEGADPRVIAFKNHKELQRAR